MNDSRRNSISIDDFDTLTPQVISELPADVLLDLQGDVEKLVATATARADALRSALNIKYGEKAVAAMHARNAENGTFKIMDSEHICEVDIPKTVEWDQGKLGSLYKAITDAGQDPLVYMTRILKVSDTALKAWPAEIQKSFREARSYKHGRFRFKLRAAKVTGETK